MFILDIINLAIIFMMEHFLIILPVITVIAFIQIKLESRRHEMYWAGVDATLRREVSAYPNETTPNFLDN